jgi:Domain of unknown function (DUF4283)
MHKSWCGLGLIDITSVSEGLFVANFKKAGESEKVATMGPWHFRQDLIAIKLLSDYPCEEDKADCTIQLWVQIHKVPLQQMTKAALRKLATELSVLMDPNLEGSDKWDRFIRTRLEINPTKPLKDKIVLCLPNGSSFTALVHYERVLRFCFYYAKIGHETETCEEHVCLMARIRSYPPELHQTLEEKLRPTFGGRVTKSYLLDRGSKETMAPSLNSARRPDYLAGQKRTCRGTGESSCSESHSIHSGGITGLDLNTSQELVPMQTVTISVTSQQDAIQKRKQQAVGKNSLPLFR